MKMHISLVVIIMLVSILSSFSAYMLGKNNGYEGGKYDGKQELQGKLEKLQNANTRLESEQAGLRAQLDNATNSNRTVYVPSPTPSPSMTSCTSNTIGSTMFTTCY